MTARIKRFYTRAELGMKKPTAVSHNITPQNGGVAGHYGGGGPNPPPSTFEAAKRIWLGWQAYHMNGQGWRDIAYTAGYDNLGNVYAGRGLNVRCGANGSNFGNQNYYAFVWIGGGSAVPSQAAKDAYEWLVYWARTKGNAGMRSRPHYHFTSTSCAGKNLSPFVLSLDNKKIVLPSTAPPPVVKPPVVTVPTGKSIDMYMFQCQPKGEPKPLPPVYVTNGTHYYWLETAEDKARITKEWAAMGIPTKVVITDSMRGHGVLVGPDYPPQPGQGE